MKLNLTLLGALLMAIILGLGMVVSTYEANYAGPRVDMVTQGGRVLNIYGGSTREVEIEAKSNNFFAIQGLKNGVTKSPEGYVLERIRIPKGEWYISKGSDITLTVYSYFPGPVKEGVFVTEIEYGFSWKTILYAAFIMNLGLIAAIICAIVDIRIYERRIRRFRML